MSTVAHSPSAASIGVGVDADADIAPTEAAAADDDGASTLTRRRRLVFWICRYLPAEVSGTAAMIIAGIVVMSWTTNPALIAIAALLGETVGFYIVLAFTIYGEQWAHTQVGPHGRRRAFARTFLLLVAEFGAAELLDTLLIRPAALILGVWLIPDPVWGLLAGKIAADIVFYAIAAGAFTVTDRAGLRDPSKNASPFARLRERLTGTPRSGVAA